MKIFSSKKAQTLSILISTMGFWLILTFLVTLYNSDTSLDDISQLGMNTTFTTTALNETAVNPDQTGFWGLFSNLGSILIWLFKFFWNFLMIITIWFPVLGSATATIVIGGFLEMLRIFTYIIIFMSLKNIGG